MEPDFFEIIWGASEGENVFFPTMRDGVWTEGGKWRPEDLIPSAGNDLYDFTADNTDYYFSPLRYNGLRKKGLLGNPGVIFADMDSRKAVSYTHLTLPTTPYV